MTDINLSGLRASTVLSSTASLENPSKCTYYVIFPRWLSRVLLIKLHILHVELAVLLPHSLLSAWASALAWHTLSFHPLLCPLTPFLVKVLIFSFHPACWTREPPLRSSRRSWMRIGVSNIELDLLAGDC